MGIGDRIKARREELGWTQEDLAKRMGYKSKSTINKVEMGKVDVAQGKVITYAKILMTSVEYLMGWDEDVPTNGQNESYYLDDEAREMAEFLHKNPEYKVLFDASRKVKKEDIDFVKSMIERMS